MFDLRDFILKTIDGMIGVEPDYKVREYSLGWYTKSILVEADLGAVDALIEERNRIKNENSSGNEEIQEESSAENEENVETEEILEDMENNPIEY